MAKRASGKSPASKSKGKSGKAVDVAGPMSVSSADRDRKHLCITKISNGFLVTESGWRGNKYVERQTYTAKKPSITITPAGKGD